MKPKQKCIFSEGMTEICGVVEPEITLVFFFKSYSMFIFLNIFFSQLYDFFFCFLLFANLLSTAVSSARNRFPHDHCDV